jgi:NAD(P)H-flavin reductase
MKCVQGRWLATHEEHALPARSVFVAAGAVPNTIYAQEHPEGLKLEGDHFLPHVEHLGGLQPVRVAEHCKTSEFGPFTSYERDGRLVTFIGDTNPVFHGSVVKAIASAQRSYPLVMNALQHRPAAAGTPYRVFRECMQDLLSPRVAEVKPLQGMVELWVHAPLAARNFRPGQFYRLQTFESSAPLVQGTRLQVPLLTVSGTGVKDDRIRLLVLQWGTGPRLVDRLKPGDPLVLMGPTGAPVDMPSGQTVLVIAGRWGAAVMLDIGHALRAAGNRVLYVAAFGKADEVSHQDELEAGIDQIIWCTAAEPKITARRHQDRSVVSTDTLDLLRRYAVGELDSGPGNSTIPLRAVDRILVMGSTGLLKAWQSALNDGLRSYFKADVQAFGTVGSPMQCMLKGVCAQCLQWQVDPETGQRTRAVFSCAGQDQPLAWIDLDNLAARQTQNRLADHLSALWLDHVLTQP